MNLGLRAFAHGFARCYALVPDRETEEERHERLRHGLPSRHGALVTTLDRERGEAVGA
jgi:hypothetical protein